MKFHDWQQISSKKNLVTTFRSLGIEINRTGDVPALSVLSLMDRAAFVLSLLSELNKRRTLIRGGSLTDENIAMLQGEIDAFEDSMLRKVRTSIPRTKNENFSHLISMGYQ